MKIKQYILTGMCLCRMYFGQAQSTGIGKIGDVQRILSSTNDTTYVINFWATWCVPCVKEFPAFQELAKTHSREKLKVVMVSLDFKKDFMKSLVPFIQKHPINGEVVLLDEPDYNSWIDKVDSSWGGEIPVTIMVNGARKLHQFYGHDFTPKTLEETYLHFVRQ